jgi:acetyl esterase
VAHEPARALPAEVAPRACGHRRSGVELPINVANDTSSFAGWIRRATGGVGVDTSTRAAVGRSTVRALVGMPPVLLRRLLGPAPRSPEGATLDLQTQALIRLMALQGKRDFDAMGVAGAREDLERGSQLVGAPSPPDVAAEDRRVPGPRGEIPVRVYTPTEARASARPVLVYYHGGGFVLGSIASHDSVCRALAVGADALVVSVDYRLAPEHKFPAGVEDAVAAFRWVAREAAGALGGDPRALAVGGDSAGGNLAALVAQQTRGDAVRPAFQLLVYPATDLTRSMPSHGYFREGFLLEKSSMDWFVGHYLNEKSEETDPRGSPMHVKDLAGLPPALVTTAGFDPLRDEGRAYADRMRAAGVPVEYRCYDGLVHGFFSMAGVLDASRRALDDAVAALRTAFATSAARRRA